jgi:hypothetical protein
MVDSCFSVPDMTRAKDYLTLSTAYCRYLGGVRWSDHEDALVYADGRFFAFSEAVAFFLEGFGSECRLIHFAHIIHLIDLVLDTRHLNTPEITRLRHLFFGTGGYWRNAGALAGVLCREVPEVADPPALEQVLSRLRDRTFPIRYYVGQFHDTGRALEQPAVPPAQFEERILRMTAAYSDDELRAWFQTGRGPVKEAGQAIAREKPGPLTLLGTLAALLDRPRLAGAETYVTQLVGALALPPRRLARQELPVGGYADMTNQGNFEAILPSQFALEELEFFRRFAERELLYFRREEPPAQNKQELVILLDQGVRTWGDVRLVLAAAAVALGKQAVRNKTPFLLAATSNGGRLVAPAGVAFEELARLVEASDLTAHPALALEAVLEQPGEADRDIVLLTHPRNVLEPDVRHAARRLGRRDRLFTVALAADGPVTMSELRHGAAVKIRQFRVAFEEARVPYQPKPEFGWAGAVEPVPFPFRFGVDSFISHFDFDYDGNWLVTASRDGMLHVWKTSGDGLEILPRAFHDRLVLRHPQAMVGVAGGIVVAGQEKNRLVIVHYDLNRRRSRVHAFDLEAQQPTALLYSRAHHAVVCKSSHSVAVDLETGASYTAEPGGPNSRAKQAFEDVIQGTLRPRELGVYTEKPDSVKAGFFRAGPSLEILDGDESWPPFVPTADGRPILADASLQGGQKCCGTAALKIRRPQKRPDSILLLAGPPGTVVGEHALPGAKFKFQLAQNGTFLARQVGDCNVEVRPVGGAGTVFTTRAGGASHQVRLHVGEHGLLLAVGESHRHQVRWDTGKLETLYGRAGASLTQRVLEKWSSAAAPIVEARAGTAVSGCNYDAERFVAEAVRNGLTFLADRFGQVAVLGRGGNLIAMFMAFRERFAGWLPDGTQVGSTALLGGPATSGAGEKIARALKDASA